MKAAEEALPHFPANRAVGDEHVVARWCGRDITAAHFRLASEALALIRAEAAAVPADREALARRLQARADELGTAYADDKAMLTEAATMLRRLSPSAGEK
jgi:hypothetical protein